MRLAFVNSTHRWGGVKTWCMDMGRCALEDGHDVFVYGRDERFVRASRQAGMKAFLTNFGPDFNPLRIATFRSDFRRYGVTHVIVNVGKDLRTAGVAARLAGLPVVVHVGAPADFSDTWLRRLVHHGLGPAYVCCSSFTREHILEGVPWLAGSRVEVIHPGTAMPAEPPAPSRTSRVLIATSQLTRPKRHEDLIRACGLLFSWGIPFELRIVGAGDQERPLRDLTRQLGLNEVVHFLGYVPDVAAELRRADIFVLPTDAEPLGIALEEAMAHGLYPVARNAGGVPEIWPASCRENLLSPDAGPEEFAVCLRAALSLDSRELDRRRRAVQEHARRTFSRERQFRLFREFLLSLAS